MELEPAKAIAGELIQEAMGEPAPPPPVTLLEGELCAQLYHWYWEEKMTTGQIGQILGRSDTWVSDMMEEGGIPRRTTAQASRVAVETGRHAGLSRKGEAHPRWNGGRVSRGEGYIGVYSPDHPRAHLNYVLEHILVWEANHGPLPPGWAVHHLNGRKDDNRPRNLLALPRTFHDKAHGKGRPSALLIRALRQRIRELEAKLAQRGLSGKEETHGTGSG